MSKIRKFGKQPLTVILLLRVESNTNELIGLLSQELKIFKQEQIQCGIILNLTTLFRSAKPAFFGY